MSETKGTSERVIRVRVMRGYDANAKERIYKEYEVPFTRGMSVLNVLDYIYTHLDHSLSIYYSCRIGRCNACDTVVNGKTAESCTAPCEGDMTIEPIALKR
jgi:succinate dehydrogenase/fumarate reductase-like Fe-S protein